MLCDGNCADSFVALCAGFWTPAMTSPPPADAAGVQKAPRHEIAVGSAPAVPQALWGLSHGVWLDEVGGRRWLRSVCRIGRVSTAP
jgi:hypothetical protein